MNDRDYMARALELAAKGEGAVNPNPLVGAVVVADSKIVGEGWHRQFGGPHAEVHALNEAGAASNGATLYVTLEPCCHHGKTPPCTDRIIAAGIRRVVVATRDPNPAVNGKGLSQLRDAGIKVVESVMESEALQQNEVFFTFMTQHRPFVHLKLAMSLDGRIATKMGDAKWITGDESRIEGHRLRARHMAIAVGVETVIQDNPSLTVRHVEGKDPRPIVLDTTGRAPLSSKLLQAPSKAIIATCSMSEETEQKLLETGAQVWRLPAVNNRVSIQALLSRMGEAQIDSLLIEGGGEVAASFLEARAIDKVSFFYAPILIGGRRAVPGIGGIGIERMSEALRLERVQTRMLGEDFYLTGYPSDRTGS